MNLFVFLVGTIVATILVNNAVVKQVGISLLICVQLITYNIRVYLDKVVKISIYYYAEITPGYAGITPVDGAKVILTS